MKNQNDLADELEHSLGKLANHPTPLSMQEWSAVASLLQERIAELRRPTPPPDVAKVEQAIKAARCERGCHSYDTPTDWSNPYCSCQAKAKAAIAALQETKP